MASLYLGARGSHIKQVILDLGAAKQTHPHRHASTERTSKVLLARADGYKTAPQSRRHSIISTQSITSSSSATPPPEPSSPSAAAEAVKQSQPLVTIPKHLPNTEAMLNHKRFRAISVELTDMPPGLIAPENGDAKQSMPTRDTLVSVEPVVSQIALTGASASSGEARMDVLQASTGGGSQRKMKNVQDHMSLVSDTIAKLALQATASDKPLPPLVVKSPIRNSLEAADSR